MAEAEETAAPSYEETLRRGAETEKAVLAEQIAEEKAAQQAGLANIQRARAGQQPEWERFKQKQMDVERMAPPPVLEKPPPAPRTQEMIQPSSLERSVGMASIFALLSVGMAKGSAIYGLKALGGFLTGAHAGNLEQADASIKDFNNEMKRVHDANEYSRQQYLDVFNNKKYTLEMQEHAFHIKALEFKDELAIEKYKTDGMKGVHDLIRERANVDTKFGLEMQKYRQWEETIRHHKAMEAKGGAGAPGEETVFGIKMEDVPVAPPGQKNEEFLNMLPPATAAIVKRIAAGDIDLKTYGGMGTTAALMRKNYGNAAIIYDPNFKTRTAGVLEKAAKEATPGGKVGANTLAINTVAHHIDQYVDRFKDLSNSQIERWNKTKNAVRTEFGDPKLDALKVPAGFAAGEIARIIKGGNAAPTEQEIKYWEGVFNTSASPQRAMAVVWEAMEGIGGRLTEVEAAYRAMGDTEFKALRPEMARLLLKHKPKGKKTPPWLEEALKRGGGERPEDLSRLEKEAELSPERAAEIKAEQQARVRGALPHAKNPKTGEEWELRDGQWQLLPKK